MKHFDVSIEPSVASGRVTPPPSKSISHRALISAALASGESLIYNPSLSDDILATIDAVRAIGATVESVDGGGALKLLGVGGKPSPMGVIDCRESGSTLRFLIPICLLSENSVELVGSPRLLSRPLGAYIELFGDRVELIGNKKVLIKEGPAIRSGKYTLDGNISSQYITGLLFALSLCDGESEIRLATTPQSAPYIDLTVDMLSRFGVSVRASHSDTNYSFWVKGVSRYIPTSVTVEADASCAAFFGALCALGGQVELDGLNPNSLQGDSIFPELIRAVSSGERAPIDLGSCPDLAPILFALSAHFGYGEFTHTNRLRLKESDRIHSCETELSKLGASFTVSDEGDGRVIVHGGALHPPISPLCSHNDHRIAMSLAVLATKYGGTITDAQCVSKSMPTFFELLSSLGISLSKAERWEQ